MRGQPKQAAPEQPQSPPPARVLTPRDDQWWVPRVLKWKADNPGMKQPIGKISMYLDLPCLAAEQGQVDFQGRTNLDDLLDRYVDGTSLPDLAEHLTDLFGFRVSHAQLRQAMTYTPERCLKYNAARAHYADWLVDQAMVDAKTAKLSGDVGAFKFSADLNLKVASKLSPSAWGDKTQLEIGGIPGGAPIQNENLQQSPAEAYQAMVARKAGVK